MVDWYKDTDTSRPSDTVINCPTQIFTFFGLPGYIHFDLGTFFMSEAVKAFLYKRGVAISHSTSYHPTENVQYEKNMGIVWKTIHWY